MPPDLGEGALNRTVAREDNNSNSNSIKKNQYVMAIMTMLVAHEARVLFVM
jgi:hypothetical protein